MCLHSVRHTPDTWVSAPQCGELVCVRAGSEDAAAYFSIQGWSYCKLWGTNNKTLTPDFSSAIYWFMCPLFQTVPELIQKGEFFLSVLLDPERHSSQFNQLDYYSVFSNSREERRVCRKEQNITSLITSKNSILILNSSSASVWHLQTLACMLSVEAASCFFLIVNEEVFWSDGRSLTQSLFSFCFRGEGAASPLNSRRRRLGDALTRTDRPIGSLNCQQTIGTIGSCEWTHMNIVIS